MTEHFDSRQLHSLVMQLQTQMATVQEQIHEHQSFIERLDRLEKENQALHQTNQEQERIIAELRTQLETPHRQTEASTQPISYAAKAAIKPTATAPRTIKKRIAAARAFQTPDTQGPKGFEYVYIGRSRKIDRSEVRSRLRRTGVDTGRVLDICFPASGVIGILVHAQYTQEFKAIMKESEAEIIDAFEPLSPETIADPKYGHLSETERADLASQLVHKRAMNTLSFLRPINVGPVGRSFVELGWIDDADLVEAMNIARERLQSQDPKKAAFLFKTNTLKTKEDSDMEL